ncbi:hypothetical protein NGM10_12205 [Halorussus salilacus]|uniref:hypothetical protein n=1 Tax=Halorussus salilacus TaxID=2953750 RepID=UPI0020A06736|nr:hypothetical protein [Halorussus salilacus]USZ67487.1 hypothetical protein NGM10_12205 [Halorussus salilacus]
MFALASVGLAEDWSATGDSGIDEVDPTVAAVADVFGEPVVTDNVGDFEALGVDIEGY